MKNTFQQQLNEELLRSERRRTVIIIGIFLFAIGYRVIDNLFFKADEEAVLIQSFTTVWLFPFIIILFELFSLLYINKRIKTSGNQIPPVMQYLNTAAEICLPSLIIFSVAKQYPSYDVLKSPALYIYFVFIILSTLRLNFGLSFFCGLLSSAAYVLISVVVYHHFNTNDSGKAIILLLSGVAAGLVANQIKDGINNSLREAERRHKVENLFGQQISREIAEKMLENDGKIESKRMMVAVMFIDIRNFTQFAAGRRPEEIVQYQNAFFGIVIRSVSKYNGIVHQFLGDGCMVTFGAPLAMQNPSEKAVYAAMELLEQLDRAVHDQELPATRIGVGIHTGEAITGNIGTANRYQYSVTGSVVILASRIEQLNKQLQSNVLVSKEVADNIDRSAIEVNSYGLVSVKGFDDPVSIYKLA
jgi:adenylate cyclase